MIEIEVNGQKLQAEPGEMLIQAMDRQGVYVPRFCYHKKLSVAANCRMCLVDVDKIGKPQPACATPVRDGMVVRTKSEKAVEAQKSVMEFLLINHPLDCPICDQGGECELQDLAVGYGSDISQYTEGKRSVADENLGSLIATDMTRCIHCTRCVRFGKELAGMPELGATDRGEHMRIGTYVEKSLVSELSGNMIDVCPVGALTSKPFRFKARAWELQQRPSVAAHDGIGANLYVHARGNKVMRVVPRENEAVNEVWLSDRDRFSYLGLDSEDRFASPMVRYRDKWQELGWEEALESAVKQLQRVLEQQGADQVAVIASPNATTEELYLLQKIFRALGCANLDHRLRMTDTDDQAMEDYAPGINQSINELEQNEAVLLIGSNVRHEQPLAGMRLRKAAMQGAAVMAVNCIDYEFAFDLSDKWIVSPNNLISSLAEIAKALPEVKSFKLGAIQKLINSATPGNAAKAIAKKLQQAGKASVLLGALANQHPHASVIRQLARYIAEASESVYGCFTDGANTAGAWSAGMIPHRLPGGKAAGNIGENVAQLFAKPRKAYVLFNVEPEFDCANPKQAQAALSQADCVIAINTFMTELLREVAHVALPLAPFTETEGTFVNMAGEQQAFRPVVLPWEGTKPGWKILRVLANMLDLPGFDYQQNEEVTKEWREIVDANQPEKISVEFALPELNAEAVCRITEWPIYCVDPIVRRSEALQHSLAQSTFAVRVNEAFAKRLNLSVSQLVYVKQNEQEVTLPWVIDDRIPDNCVYIPAGYKQSSMLGDNFGAIEIYA